LEKSLRLKILSNGRASLKKFFLCVDACDHASRTLVATRGRRTGDKHQRHQHNE
jgi:hypothetical protein